MIINLADGRKSNKTNNTFILLIFEVLRSRLQAKNPHFQSPNANQSEDKSTAAQEEQSNGSYLQMNFNLSPVFT